MYSIYCTTVCICFVQPIYIFRSVIVFVCEFFAKIGELCFSSREGCCIQLLPNSPVDLPAQVLEEGGEPSLTSRLAATGTTGQNQLPDLPLLLLSLHDPFAQSVL